VHTPRPDRRLPLNNRRLRTELHDAAVGAAALAAVAAGDERALPRPERVERMRLEAQRLDLQLRVRRERELTPAQREADKDARQIVSRELGHEREQITAVYLGR
jgi:hypothetical protein